MSGIAGFIDSSLKYNKDSSKEILYSMSNKIIHRGPDDSGQWQDNQKGINLSHRRLSVIDTSHGGNQPMISKSERYIISYNGEIYNHLQIRKKIEINKNDAWRSHSDTETLLEYIDKLGIYKAIDKIVGMFAFSLFDRRENKIYLVRDRVGEKPLYYGHESQKKNFFLFSSDLASILEFPDFEKTIDPKSVTSFLKHNYIPAPDSIYKNIYKLEPGSILEFDLLSKNISKYKYWSNPILHSENNEFDNNASYKLEEILTESISQQLISDVPLGAFLSGGVDSSLIVALMQKITNGSTKTFSIGFEDEKFNEAGYAKAVASYLKTNHTEMIVSSKEAMSVIPKLPKLYSEPFSDSSQIPTYLVSLLAKKNVTVALSGDGGDEIFGGYTRYEFTKKFWSKMKHAPYPMRKSISLLIKALLRSSDYTNIKLPDIFRIKHFQDKLFKAAEAMASKNFNDLYSSIVSHHNNPAIYVNGGVDSKIFDKLNGLEHINSEVDKMMHLDFNTYLPDDIMVKVDRASMGVSLETRAPFLNHKVIEYASNLSNEWKFGNKKTGFSSKHILREILYRHVPRKLIERPKMGFGVPIEQWLKKDLNSWASDLMTLDNLKKDDILEPYKTHKLWNDYLKGKHNNHYLIWNFLMFQSWKNYYS